MKQKNFLLSTDAAIYRAGPAFALKSDRVFQAVAGCMGSLLSHTSARLILALLSIGWATTAQTFLVKGRVESGGNPVNGASTLLYLAGNAKNAPAQLLATAASDAFQLSTATPTNGENVFYLIAVGGSTTPSS